MYTLPGGGFDPEHAPQIGNLVRTGVPAKEGGEIVVRFFGNADEAVARVGQRDEEAGVEAGRSIGASFCQPFTSIGFDDFSFSAESVSRTHVIIGFFIGPVDRMAVETGCGEPLQVHFARWSAHPELVVYWAPGLPENRVAPAGVKITAYDAGGKVLDSTGSLRDPSATGEIKGGPSPWRSPRVVR